MSDFHKMGRPMKYRWDELDIGDEVLFESEPSGSQSRPAMAAKAWAKRNGLVVVCRKHGNGVKIARVK